LRHHAERAERTLARTAPQAGSEFGPRATRCVARRRGRSRKIHSRRANSGYPARSCPHPTAADRSSANRAPTRSRGPSSRRAPT
jgi:hypothetical protein